MICSTKVRKPTRMSWTTGKTQTTLAWEVWIWCGEGTDWHRASVGVTPWANVIYVGGSWIEI